MDEVDVESMYAGDEDGVFVVAFGMSVGERLVFQLADRVDRQDAMLGMDSYSISTAAGATVYGGVTSATVANPTLVFTLSDEAAATLGLPRVVRLRLFDGTAVETALAGLRRIGISVRRVS